MPGPDRDVLDRLARSLPDVPRWIETRSMLLSGDCELFGVEDGTESSFVVRDPEDVPISVVGCPHRHQIEAAVARGWEGDSLIAAPEDAPYVSSILPDWRPVPAKLHLLGDEARLLQVPEGAVRMLEPSELDGIEGVPDDLRSWLGLALSRDEPVAASLEEGRPVAFCCAASRTETLWDISIDTLDGFRRRGHAARSVAYMIEHMRPLRPVWGAEETNPASLGLAAKLGFVVVDELVVFHTPRN